MFDVVLESPRGSVPGRHPPVTTSNRVVLALDLGTTTGWAMCLPDGGIVSGTVSFRPSRYEGGGIRYVRFRAGDVLDVNDPEIELTRYRLLGTGFFSSVDLSLRKG